MKYCWCHICWIVYTRAPNCCGYELLDTSQIKPPKICEKDKTDEV